MKQFQNHRYPAAQSHAAYLRQCGEGALSFTQANWATLKDFKDDAKEVTTNMECGMIIKNYNDINPGDMIEAFEEVEVKRTL